MSILSNIISAITAPKTETFLDGDALNNDFTGGLKNDKLVFDATSNFGETITDYSKLDGGFGIDTLAIKLTESQHTALLDEFRAKVGAVKADGLDLSELISLFKIATGQQFVKFKSIGVELKSFEIIKFDVVADPKPLYVDEHGRGNFSGSDKSIDLNLVTSSLQFEEGVQKWDVTKSGKSAYFADGDAVEGFSFAPWQYIGSNYSDRMIGNEGIQAISGEGGNDFIYGNGGNDELRGETGDDYLSGGEGNDWLIGGEGNDTVYGGNGEDRIGGGNGIDIIYGEAGDDAIWGDAGNDTIRGGLGADTINGGAGHDSLYAGQNDGAVDTFVFDSSSVGDQSNVWGSADYIYDFVSGQDKVEIDTADGNALLTFQTVGANTHVYVTGDFDGNGTSEKIGMSFVSTTVTASDFLFV